MCTWSSGCVWFVFQGLSRWICTADPVVRGVGWAAADAAGRAADAAGPSRGFEGVIAKHSIRGGESEGFPFPLRRVTETTFILGSEVISVRGQFLRTGGTTYRCASHLPEGLRRAVERGSDGLECAHVLRLGYARSRRGHGPLMLRAVCARWYPCNLRRRHFLEFFFEVVQRYFESVVFRVEIRCTIAISACSFRISKCLPGFAPVWRRDHHHGAHRSACGGCRARGSTDRTRGEFERSESM